MNMDTPLKSTKLNYNNSNLVQDDIQIAKEVDGVKSESETDDESDDCFTILDKPVSTDCTVDVETGLANGSVRPLSREIALVKLTERTRYEIMQENGQRRFGPPPDWQGPPPGRGCEIFIGKIPRDCFEDELVPIFEQAGKIYMFRLMMDFSGCNRGYGFCIYTNREDTKRAVLELDNYEIRKGRVLGVCQSLDNCRLFVGGIPKCRSRLEILDEMCRITEGVKDVIVYPCPANRNKNRGFAFVEYESHKSAAMARRKLIPSRYQLFGHQIAVDWAEPEREVDDETMSKVRILYVRGLMVSISEDRVKAYFNDSLSQCYGESKQIMSARQLYNPSMLVKPSNNFVERVKKIRDYAFVHFVDRNSAALAMRILHGTILDGSRLEISWAKPADRFTRSKLQMTYTSSYFDTQSSTLVQRNDSFPSMDDRREPLRKEFCSMQVNMGLGNQINNNQAFDYKNQASINGQTNGNLSRNEVWANSPGPQMSLVGSYCTRKTPDYCNKEKETFNSLGFERCEYADSELLLITPLSDKLTELSNQLGFGTPKLFTQVQSSFGSTKNLIYCAQIMLANLNRIFSAPQLSTNRRKAAQDVVVHTYEWLIRYSTFKMTESSYHGSFDTQTIPRSSDLDTAFNKMQLGSM